MKGATVPERSNYQSGVPCWVDLMTTDLPTAQRFYAEVFGWEVEDMGEEFGHYGMATLRGKRVAGIGPVPPGQSMSSWNTYLATNNLDATAAKAKDASGTIVVAPMDIGDAGRMAMLQDPAGALVGFWQPGTNTGAQLVNEPGALCWNEVHVRDGDAADSFYGAVFGYETEQLEGDLDYKMYKVDGNAICGRLAMSGEAAEEMPSMWLCYFAVESTDAALDQIRASGGSVMFGPEDTPYGRMAQCADPAGAGFAVIQMMPETD